jgi:predicted phosphodiesterase
MKIAILSDIRSNVYALEAVINDAKSKSVNMMINAGDSFYGPIEPRATYELLRVNNFVNICGNEDRKILEASLEQLENDDMLKFVYEDLKEEVLYWIQDLPFEKFLGADLYVIHGTQHDDSNYLLEDISSGKPFLRDDKKIIELLDDVESKFVVCGHSGIPRYVNLSSGQVVLNPGSVGLQAFKEQFPKPHIIENKYKEATYIILDVDSGAYNIELIKVAYDFEKAALKAQERGRDDWAYTLRTGEVLPSLF